MSPLAEAALYYRANQTATVLSAVLNGLAGILLVVFTTELRRLLSPDRDSGWSGVGFAGSVIFTTLLLAVGAVQLGMPPAATNPLTVRPLLLLWNAGVATLSLAAVPMLAGFGASSLNSLLLRRWIGWSALAGAVAGLIGAVALPLRGRLAQLLSFVGALQYPALFVWLAASSFVVLRVRPKDS